MTALPRVLVAALPRRPGSVVRVCGWFEDGPAVRDHTGSVRLVHREDGPALDAPPGSAVDVVGVVSTAGGAVVAVAVEAFEVAGRAASPLPIADTSPLEERLDWRYLDLRHPRNRLIFEVQTTVERVMRAYWEEHGFLEIHSPKLRPIPNKSGTSLFEVAYFGRRIWLAQSPQFYKQMAIAAGFDRVFEIAPVFRAQPDATSRHDTEFTSVDIEMAWIDSHEDVMAVEEAMLRRVLDVVADRHGDAIRRRFGVDVVVPSLPFPRVTIEEARAVVAATGWPVDPDDDDLDAEGERRLAAHAAREHGHDFVFVTGYPVPARPFYHMRCTDDSRETRSFDLLYRGLEITSGAQREHRHDRLVAQARERGVPVEVIATYLDFFKYGCPPHGGFGLGLTRLLMSLLRLGDVREATYLFRGPDRVTP